MPFCSFQMKAMLVHPMHSLEWPTTTEPSCEVARALLTIWPGSLPRPTAPMLFQSVASKLPSGNTLPPTITLPCAEIPNPSLPIAPANKGSAIIPESEVHRNATTSHVSFVLAPVITLPSAETPSAQLLVSPLSVPSPTRPPAAVQR